MISDCLTKETVSFISLACRRDTVAALQHRFRKLLQKRRGAELGKVQASKESYTSTTALISACFTKETVWFINLACRRDLLAAFEHRFRKLLQKRRGAELGKVEASKEQLKHQHRPWKVLISLEKRASCSKNPSALAAGTPLTQFDFNERVPRLRRKGLPTIKKFFCPPSFLPSFLLSFSLNFEVCSFYFSIKLWPSSRFIKFRSRRSAILFSILFIWPFSDWFCFFLFLLQNVGLRILSWADTHSPERCSSAQTPRSYPLHSREWRDLGHSPRWNHWERTRFQSLPLSLLQRPPRRNGPFSI